MIIFELYFYECCHFFVPTFFNPNSKHIFFVLDILPLISVNIIAIGYQAGLGPIPWSYTGKRKVILSKNVHEPPKKIVMPLYTIGAEILFLSLQLGRMI